MKGANSTVISAVGGVVITTIAMAVGIPALTQIGQGATGDGSALSTLNNSLQSFCSSDSPDTTVNLNMGPREIISIESGNSASISPGGSEVNFHACEEEGLTAEVRDIRTGGSWNIRKDGEVVRFSR